MTLAELQAAAAQLVASRDLSAAEAELAGANLVLLGGEGGPRHVWYGDPLLSTSEQRHSVEVRVGLGCGLGCCCCCCCC